MDVGLCDFLALVILAVVFGAGAVSSTREIIANKME
jgi:hypothetical protein